MNPYFEKVLLLAYSPEISLKGKNRSDFVGLLKRNIISALATCLGKENFNVELDYSRFIISFSHNFWESNLVHKVISSLRRVFGISSLSIAYKTGLSIESIEEISLLVFKQEFQTGTFKVEAHRSNKSFPLISPEINKQVASRILSEFRENPPIVNLDNPYFVIHIEILSSAFVFTRRVPCVSGLPSFIQGSAFFDLDGLSNNNVQEFLLSAFLIVRKGVRLIFFNENLVDEGVLASFLNQFRCFSSSVEFTGLSEVLSSHALIVEPLNRTPLNFSKSRLVFPLLTDSVFLGRMSSLLSELLGDSGEC